MILWQGAPPTIQARVRFPWPTSPALRDSGLRVPEDVSVVGVDDSLDDFVAHNELTTVRFDLHQRGREVFEHAVPEVGTVGKTVAIRIPGQLIIRHSTAIPRA